MTIQEQMANLTEEQWERGYIIGPCDKGHAYLFAERLINAFGEGMNKAKKGGFCPDCGFYMTPAKRLEGK